MNSAKMATHRCYRCCAHDVRDLGERTEVESVTATFAEGGGEVFFTSGYSAREIAQKHARNVGGSVYVNNVSRSIKRRDMNVPVAYAVATAPVYTLRPPDEYHATVYRAYWPPL